MLEGFEVLPAQLSSLGLYLYEEQLGLAIPEEGWALTWIDLGTLIDPFGMSEYEWVTADGVSCNVIKVPVCFYFTNEVDGLFSYEVSWEEYLEDHWNGDKFWQIPRLTGVTDLPWAQHVLCGCGDDSYHIDARPLWSLWPISDKHNKLIDDMLMVLYEEFLSNAHEVLNYEYYEEEEPDHTAAVHALFRSDGRLRVSSGFFDLSEFTDDQDLLDAWFGVKYSDVTNSKAFNAIYYSL